MKVLRTPDERFANLEGYDFASHPPFAVRIEASEPDRV